MSNGFTTPIRKTPSVIGSNGHSTRFYPAPTPHSKDDGFIVKNCKPIYGTNRSGTFVELPSMRSST